MGGPLVGDMFSRLYMFETQKDIDRHGYLGGDGVSTPVGDCLCRVLEGGHPPSHTVDPF